MKKKSTSEMLNLLIEYAVLLIGFYGILLVSFRFVRDAFPKPKISKDSVVGYIQYNGYPFYFDTLLFFIIISVPIMVCLLIYYRKKFFK